MGATEEDVSGGEFFLDEDRVRLGILPVVSCFFLEVLGFGRVLAFASATPTVFISVVMFIYSLLSIGKIDR
jgi:hypothetical protein